LEWREPGFDLEKDTRLVVSPRGAVAAYCEVWNPDEPYVLPFSWGRVHPEAAGKGIGSQLLNWAESRAREDILKAPPGTRVALRTFTLTSAGSSTDLFAKAGFNRVRYFFRMVTGFDAPPQEPVWPAGISVRTFRVGMDERAMVNAVRESFQDHWGYVERPFEEELGRWQHRMDNDPEFDPALWFLAVDDGEIAGVSLCLPKVSDDPDMGWVQTLGVRRPWRKRGLGLALLQHSFGEFYRRGVRKVGLGVDAQNLTGALHLYEKAGMRSDATREACMYEKELRPGIDLSKQSVELD
jgi:GNAT superfamily N-acetyltransferase